MVFSSLSLSVYYLFLQSVRTCNTSRLFVYALPTRDLSPRGWVAYSTDGNLSNHKAAPNALNRVVQPIPHVLAVPSTVEARTTGIFPECFGSPRVQVVKQRLSTPVFQNIFPRKKGPPRPVVFVPASWATNRSCG